MTVASQELSFTSCNGFDNLAGNNGGIRFGGDVFKSTSDTFDRNVVNGGLGSVFYMTTTAAEMTVTSSTFTLDSCRQLSVTTVQVRST